MKNLISSAYFCWNSISQTLWHSTQCSSEAANILQSKKRKKKQVPTLNKQFTLFSYREEQKSHPISKSRLQYSGFNTCSPIVIFLCYNGKPQHTKLTWNIDRLKKKLILFPSTTMSKDRFEGKDHVQSEVPT